MKKTLLLFVAAVISTFSAFAEERVVTITAEDALWGTDAGAYEGTKDGVTIATGRGMSGADAYRSYKDEDFTVSVAEGSITGIELTCTANGTTKYGPGGFGQWSVGDYTFEGKVGTWTGEAESVVFTATLNQVRMTSIKVTYIVGAPAPEATSLALTEAAPVQTEYYVGEKFSVEGLVATATFVDETTDDVTERVTWGIVPAEIAADTKSVTVTATYKNVSDSKTYDVAVKSIANTAETAYTVEEAVALIDAGRGLSVDVFVKGTISNVQSFNSKYGSITYLISADGTENGRQFMCYGGLNIGGEKFGALEDLTVGDHVVVMGKLKKYGETYEFDLNNVIVSLVSVGVDGIVADEAKVEGKRLENGKVVVLKAGKKYTVAGQRVK